MCALPRKQWFEKDLILNRINTFTNVSRETGIITIKLFHVKHFLQVKER